jgi:hypothetical protein
MIELRSGPAAAVGILLAASLCLGASCRSGHPGLGGGAPLAATGDTINKAQHLLDFGGGRRSRGLIEGIFDQGPSADREPPDHAVRQSQPYADMMRHAFGPGRQAYEVPLQQARAPRPARLPRHNRP